MKEEDTNRAVTDERGQSDNHLAQEFSSRLSLSEKQPTGSDNDGDTPFPSSMLLLLDAGYGFPSQKKPRKEKILAVSKQIVNVLQWQQQQQQQSSSTSRKTVSPMDQNTVGAVGGDGHRRSFCSTLIVGCRKDERARGEIMARIQELMMKTTSEGVWSPTHFKGFSSHATLESFVENSLVEPDQQQQRPIYLSPDADEVLDVNQHPPPVVIIGLLIDRRIQLDRSKLRAAKLQIAAKRLPLDDYFRNIPRHEPLNVDTVMEIMQQWCWNCRETDPKEAYIRAVQSALERHHQRHPNRTIHANVVAKS